MNTNLPLVSIIIPTYNGAKRIVRTLESLVTQDYDNIEIIVVDDVSTDNTVEICQELLTKSGRQFQIIKRTENGRQSASRNTGLRAAKGKYVIFFDHDDLCEKNFVSSLCNKAESKQADVVFCEYCQYYEQEDRYTYDHIKLHRPYSHPEDYLRAWASKRIIFLDVWTFIFKKKFLDERNLHFTERCYFGEDTEFVLKALTVSSYTSFIKSCLYIHVKYPEQQTQANKFIRNGQYLYHQTRLSCWRTGRYVARNIQDKNVQVYARSFYMPDAVLKEFTMLAEAGAREKYERLWKTTRHKKFQSFMLSTYRVITYVPELFLKSLMLIYTPRFYYWLRSKTR